MTPYFGAGKGPTFKANEQNGKGVVRFNGLDQQIGAYTIGTYMHFFIVAKHRLPQFINYNGLLGSYDNLILVGGGPGTTDFYPYQTYGYHKNGVTTPALAGPMAAWAVMSISWPSQWVNWLTWLGSDRGFADRWWDGDVAEVIGYDHVLTDPERIQVQDYLKTKWGTP